MQENKYPEISTEELISELVRRHVVSLFLATYQDLDKKFKCKATGCFTGASAGDIQALANAFQQCLNMRMSDTLVPEMQVRATAHNGRFQTDDDGHSSNAAQGQLYSKVLEAVDLSVLEWDLSTIDIVGTLTKLAFNIQMEEVNFEPPSDDYDISID